MPRTLTFDLTLGEAAAIGSAIVHVHEFFKSGRPLDLMTFEAALGNGPLHDFMAKLQRNGLLPVRRDGITY